MGTGPSSAELRAELGHPIVDADGHMLELLPATEPYLREALGAAAFDRYQQRGPVMRRAQAARSLDERVRTGTPQGAWWGTHTRNVLDRATAMLPALLHERMDEIGIDFSVLYPTNTLTTCAEPDPELRAGLCRGFNDFYAAEYGGYADRLTAAGMIPMHTPAEAVAELDHCAEIGLKVAAFPEGVLRPLAEPAGENHSPWLWPGQAHWFDTFGLDSAHDYDAVWSRAQELGFAITFHGGLAVRPGPHTSPSSYCFNHIFQFQSVMLPLCKSLFMGGVTKRFPDLPFVFLECGVSWGVQLLLDTVEHWEKRRLPAIRENFDPARLDSAELGRLFERYGQAFRDAVGGDLARFAAEMPIHGGTPEQMDEWIHLGAQSPEDLVGWFADSFYFGCEADDRGVGFASAGVLPGGASLRPVLSSDIGHWDVTEIGDVVRDAFSLRESGIVGDDAFGDFLCGNALRMYTAANPDFFDGTPVEGYARAHR